MNKSIKPASSSQSIFDQLIPDRDTSEPVYQQLLRKLQALIAAGEIVEGQSLPSERLLAERLNLSRTTVRRCYEALRSMEVIDTQGRSGVKIRQQPPPLLSPQLGKLKSFTQEMSEMGMQPSTQLLERSIVKDRTIASIFNRPSTAQFLKLVRIRLGDNIPLSREVAWYDLTAAPELADWDVEGSAYQFMQLHSGIYLKHGEQSIEAVMSTEVEAEAFGFTQPSPCLLMKRKTFSHSGQIIEYVEGTFRGDAYAYRINLEMNAAL